MRALGMTCGIGSMLIGARTAGFDIVGNIEWRKYYKTGTFEKNFEGAFYVENIKGLEGIDFSDVDMVMGHTECGNYSQLKTDSNRGKSKVDPGDIPEFIEALQLIKPRFFVMDNLAPSLIAVPASKWAEEFPDYDIFFEWISNYNYGNQQKGRKRLFIIGAKKEEGFVFQANEKENTGCVEEIIGDLQAHLVNDDPAFNHVHVDPKTIAPGWYSKKDHSKMTYKELAKAFLGQPAGRILEYMNAKNEIKQRPGYLRCHWDKHMHTISGGGWASFYNNFHHLTGMPLTIRERARLQGCPDDFIFYGSEQDMVKQTGKFMPVQFCEYISRQIAAHIEGRPFTGNGERLINPNKFVDEAKIWYCENVGYDTRQEAMCEQCWLRKTCPVLNKEVEGEKEV